LVYNLVQKQSKTRHRILKAPEYESQITEGAAILDRFLRAPDAPPKIAWLLDHHYSPAGLSFSALKGADAAKARVLVQAAARAQCAAHLGVVHIGESGRPSRRTIISMDRAGIVTGTTTTNTRKTTMKTRASLSPRSMTPGSTWTNGGTLMIVVVFGRIPITGGELLPAGALTGSLRTRSG
jgi:hypothetical protein